MVYTLDVKGLLKSNFRANVYTIFVNGLLVCTSVRRPGASIIEAASSRILITRTPSKGAPKFQETCN